MHFIIQCLPLSKCLSLLEMNRGCLFRGSGQQTMPLSSSQNFTDPSIQARLKNTAGHPVADSSLHSPV